MLPNFYVTVHKISVVQLDVSLTVHHGTLMNKHQDYILFLVCLLGVNASIDFVRYSPIFKRLCTDAIWCNYVCRMCVDYTSYT
jgi:hypothetical protein